MRWDCTSLIKWVGEATLICSLFMFISQISELLSEVQPNKKIKALEEFLHSLNKELLAIPDGSEHEVRKIGKNASKAKNPQPNDPQPTP